MNLAKRLSAHAAALAFGLSALAPGAANAAALVFDDTSPNDTITILLNDFEGGFFVNGILVQQGLNNLQSITVPEAAGPVTFSGSWIDLGQSGAGSRTIWLVEAGDPTVISDIFQYSWSSDPAGGLATIAGSFVSDFENNLGTLPVGVNPADVFIENGQSVNFSLPFLGGEIHSDVDVPEPGTLALLGLGLLPLARRFAQKRR